MTKYSRSSCPGMALAGYSSLPCPFMLAHNSDLPSGLRPRAQCVGVCLYHPGRPLPVPIGSARVPTVHVPNESSVVSGPNSIDDDGLTPEAASRRPTVQTHFSTTSIQLITAKMSQPSLAQYIIKKPALAKWMAPIANWYANAAGYRKLGLRYDTMPRPTAHCAHTIYTIPAHLREDRKEEDHTLTHQQRR